jgi:hypothetical protein
MEFICHSISCLEGEKRKASTSKKRTISVMKEVYQDAEKDLTY